MFEVNNIENMIPQVASLNTKRKGVNPFAAVDEASNKDSENRIENPFNRPDELMEAFELKDPKKRFQVLNVFPREQQQELIYLLSDEAMALGMKLYEKEKIMNLLFETTQQDISKVLKEVMPEKQIFELIPEKFLNKFLLNDELEKENFIVALEKFEPEELKKLMESMLGVPQDGKAPKEMINFLQGIPMKNLQPMFLAVEPEQKSTLIANMTKENEELFDLFQKSHLLIPLEQNDKDTTIKGLGALESEMLGGMLEGLPDELLPVLLTLIDAEVLAQALIEKYPEVITKLLTSGTK